MMTDCLLYLALHEMTDASKNAHGLGLRFVNFKILFIQNAHMMTQFLLKGLKEVSLTFVSILVID